MNLDRVVLINILDTDKNAQVNKKLPCQQCRNAEICDDNPNCKLIRYLLLRLPGTKYHTENANKIVVQINVCNDGFRRATQLTDRAIRLRSHRVR